MEIIIRNIDKAIVDRIDDMARQKGQSRNKFLKEQIQQLALYPEIFQKEDQYKRLIEKIGYIIKQNTDVLKFSPRCKYNIRMKSLLGAPSAPSKK